MRHTQFWVRVTAGTVAWTGFQALGYEIDLPTVLFVVAVAIAMMLIDWAAE